MCNFFAGFISGQLINIWISVGSAISGQKYAPLEMDLTGCPELYNITQFPPQKNYTSPPTEVTKNFFLYFLKNLYDNIFFYSSSNIVESIQ